jgi:hypothetical protein
MNKRSKLWAILGAGVLTLGVVGIALAEDLKDAHTGITVSWDSEGNPVISNSDFTDSDACEAPAQGEVIFHFVQSGQGFAPNAGGAAANLLDAFFTDEADVNDWPADSVHENNVDWFVSVDASDGSVTLDDAASNITGGELRLSHICVGDAPDEEPTPTFEQSQAGETETPPPPPPTPTFEQSQGGVTDEPTEPNTSMIGNGGTSAPADGAWLLVVALGVLLASIVVLSPARVKNPR